MIGHATVTKRAYEQFDKLEEAARFAQATIHNGLLAAGVTLSHAEQCALTAQVERDYLVTLMDQQ